MSKKDKSGLEKSNIAVPFLKWAGGKRWLVSKYPHLLPNKFGKYIEPFLGSGAVFFFLNPARAILGDINSDLINTYVAIRDDWSSVVDALNEHHRNHCKDYYYSIRDQNPSTQASRAARFIYLNRTCWNGLFRVNLKGQFNVPIGTKTSVILETDDFAQISTLLSSVDLVIQDFEKTIEAAEKGDLLFVDPPYTVNHNLNGFLKYNEQIFSWDDQKRLCRSLYRARDRGVKVILSNANHHTIRELYEDFGQIYEISRHSVLAASSAKRKPTSELLICANAMRGNKEKFKTELSYDLQITEI